MEYKISNGKIVFARNEEFDAKQILESGQIFRYGYTGDYWWCVSGDKFAKIVEEEKTVTIYTDDPQYFVRFFDLDTSYAKIKEELSKDSFMKSVINKCPGIRILKREMWDTIIEFIISANNHITRIKAIVERLCERAGKNVGEYFAFPTLDELSGKPLEFFESLGAGYRGKYLYKVVHELLQYDLNQIAKLDTASLKKFLISLSGIGPKVANCIMLFGFGRNTCFPVDTWIEKVYHENFNGKLMSRDKITEFFEQKFGEHSGIAQQYLFYAKRENILK